MISIYGPHLLQTLFIQLIRAMSEQILLWVFQDLVKEKMANLVAIWKQFVKLIAKLIVGQ